MHWWKADKIELPKNIIKYIENLTVKQSHRTQDNLRNLKLYGNHEVLGLRMSQDVPMRSRARLTLNIIQMCIDTAVARLGKTKPKPMFLTEDGDWTLQKQAKLLEQFVSGKFYELELYDIAPIILRDACTFGDGFLYFYEKNDEIKCERVFTEEIIIDEDEAVYNNPRQVHRVKFIKKEVLKELYPKFVIEIENASAQAETFMFDSLEPNIVRVVESWRLPGGKEKGRHCITISSAVLFDEPWEHDFLPFVKMSWNPRIIGYFSQGIAEVLTGVQLEINKLLKTIQIAMHLGAIPKVFVEAGSQVNKAHLNNEVAGIITYKGTPPQSAPLAGIPQELFMQLDRLYQRAFEQVGLSPLATASQKPAGLNSGRALREFHDIESERFSVNAQRYEKFFMDCAKLIVNMTKGLSKKNKDLESTVIDKRTMKKIKWSEINIKESQYVMRIYPTNFLADTPSGRLENINDLISLGLIDQVQAKKLLDYPDLEAVTSLESAVYDDVTALIEDFVEKGEYMPPEQFQDLEAAVPMIQYAYLKYKRRGLPEENLELFRRWIDDALVMMAPEQVVEEEFQEDIDAQSMMEMEAGVDFSDPMLEQAEEEFLEEASPEIGG